MVDGGAVMFGDWWWRRLVGWQCWLLVGGSGWLMVEQGCFVIGGGSGWWGGGVGC